MHRLMNEILPEINLIKSFKMLRNLLVRPKKVISSKLNYFNALNQIKVFAAFSTKMKSKINLKYTKEEYPCKKIKDDFLELTETLNNNIEKIRSLIPNAGINMTSFYLSSFASIKYADPTIFGPIYTNLENLICNVDNTEILMNILESFDKIRCSPEFYAPVPESLMKKMCAQIKKLENLMSTTFLLRTHEILKEFEPENIPEVSDLLKTLPKESCKDTEKIIQALNLDKLYEKAKKYVEILEINNDESSYLLKSDSKLLKVFGCLPQPSQSIENIKGYIYANHKKINTLLLEDMAILFEADPKNNATEPRILYKFTGPAQIENYVKIFAESQDIFEYDQSNQLIYNKINPHDKIPSEIGTTALAFFSNISPKLTSKVILMDFSMQEVIGSFLKLKSKDEIVKMIDLYNACTLLEKIKYCAIATEKGCHICNKDIQTTTPRDFISIIGGDPEYPLQERSGFYGLHMFESLINDDDMSHGVAMIGSYHLSESLKSILELVNRNSVKRIPILDRNSFMRLLMIQNHMGTLDKDLMEKLAILETIHHTIESSFFQKDDLEGDMDLTKYAEFIEKYSNEITYEKLAENNKEIIISPGICGADRLIFGDTDNVEDAETHQDDLSQTIKFIKEKQAEEQQSDSFETKRFKIKKDNEK